MLEHEEYLNWRTMTLSKQTGFVQPFKKNSIRRCQMPLMNNVAMTTHKLMGDTFDKLATSISAMASSYALWMTSQVFVTVSRVKQLKNLTFVGNSRLRWTRNDPFLKLRTCAKSVFSPCWIK